MSPARIHRQRVLAAQAAGTDATAVLASHAGGAATEYELIRTRLGLDLRRLHDIQSVEKKIELKRELLPEYDAWVEGVLTGMFENGKGVDDDVFTTIMVWRIDVGDYPGALVLAAAVLKFGLALPERYSRSPATLIAEEIADAALKALGQGGDFDFGVLQAVEYLTADHDMHDQVRAKLSAALGRQLARDAKAIDDAADGPAGGKRAKLEAAITWLKRARSLNPNVGVKKELDALEREAARLAEAAKGSAAA